MTWRARLGWTLAVLTCAAPVVAQHDQHEQHMSHSPYADQESSDISSLSAQELADLLAGAGMGLARPAELNQYPGPKHVLELTVPLELTEAQKSEVVAIHERMLTEAKRLGETIVDQERHLDRRFLHRHIDEETLRSVTEEIARLYGELRFVHLRAHLETRAVLSPDQVEAYDRLRGY